MRENEAYLNNIFDGLQLNFRFYCSRIDCKSVFMLQNECLSNHVILTLNHVSMLNGTNKTFKIWTLGTFASSISEKSIKKLTFEHHCCLLTLLKMISHGLKLNLIRILRTNTHDQ